MSSTEKAQTSTEEGTGARLRWVRKQLDLTQEAMATLLGLSLRGYQNYERAERDLPVDLMGTMKEKLGVHTAWLVEGVGERFLEGRIPPHLTAPHDEHNKSTSKFSEEYANVAFYDVEVAAGHGRSVTDPHIRPSKFNHYRLSYLSRRGLIAENLIEVLVSGDSMEPELRHGDTVLVDRSDKRIRGGAIYVFRQGDDLLVKYLQALPGDRIQVTSENHEAFPAYVIQPADIETGDVEIVGRVVRQGRDR